MTLSLTRMASLVTFLLLSFLSGLLTLYVSRIVGYTDDAFVVLAVAWAVLAFIEMYRRRLAPGRRRQ